jgi:hypothetical protein
MARKIGTYPGMPNQSPGYCLILKKGAVKIILIHLLECHAFNAGKGRPQGSPCPISSNFPRDTKSSCANCASCRSQPSNGKQRTTVFNRIQNVVQNSQVPGTTVPSTFYCCQQSLAARELVGVTTCTSQWSQPALGATWEVSENHKQFN